jgi:hypothetical protein
MFVTWNSQPQGQFQRKINYTFRREPNVTGFHLTPDMDPIDKLGWQYLWTLYEESASTTAMLKVPRAVYVEEVGRGGLAQSANGVDFGNPLTGLGIGR